MVQIQPTGRGNLDLRIPPTGVGGWFKYSLPGEVTSICEYPDGSRGMVQIQPTGRGNLDLRIPPTGVGGWFKSASLCLRVAVSPRPLPLHQAS
jgi:hypothetical protein